MLVHHRLETVVGGRRGQRGVVGRGDGAVHGRRGAVVGQLQVHAAVARGAIAGASALLSVTRSRDWMAALLPEAAVFTARSVT